MNFYRKKDAELLTASKDFSGQILAQAEQLGLTNAQCVAYAALDSAFATCYEAAAEPRTRTRAAVEARNQARKNLVAMAQQLSDYIIGNPAVSNAQLIDLGLDPRSERLPIGPPDHAPGIVFLPSTGRTVNLRLTDKTSTRRGKPDGVSGASVFSHIGPTPPAQMSDWKFLGNTSRTKVTATFDAELAPGTQVFFTAFWFNNRKQSGPAADPVSCYLAGGGVAKAA